MKTIVWIFVTAFILGGCSSKEEFVSIVQDENGQNVITSEGNKVLKTSFDKVYVYNEEFIKVQQGKKVGMANYEGNIVLEPIYEYISPLYNGYAIFGTDEQYGIVDKNMKIVAQAMFDTIQIKEGFFIVKKEGKVYCINEKLESISNQYDFIYYFVDGFARVEKENGFGFINEQCQEVIAPTYEYASDFINGFAKVQQNGKFMYINKEMKIITKEEYNNGYFFEGK